MPNIIPVPGASQNLYTLDQSLYVDAAVHFVAAQGIKGKGAIELHDHGIENLVELVFLTEGSVYSGLEDPKIVKVFGSAAVPIGVAHGNLGAPSHGQWLSVKVKGSVRYLADPLYKDRHSIAHTFEEEKKRLTVGVSNQQGELMKLLNRARGSRVLKHRHILHVAPLDLDNLQGVYRPTSYKCGQDSRYLGIEWSE